MAVVLVEINNVILRLRTDSIFTEGAEAEKATWKRMARTTRRQFANFSFDSKETDKMNIISLENKSTEQYLIEI